VDLAKPGGSVDEVKLAEEAGGAIVDSEERSVILSLGLGLLLNLICTMLHSRITSAQKTSNAEEDPRLPWDSTVTECQDPSLLLPLE